MNLKHFIHVENGAISDDLCDTIIKEYEKSDDWVPGTVNDYEIAQSRKCEAIYLSHEETIEKNFEVRKNIDNELFNIINKSLEKYVTKYGALGYINIKGDTGYILLKYNVGDYVREHVDTWSGEHRTLSCSLILNDDYEGGEIVFFDGKVQPLLKKGDLCIFPSSFTYPHQVTPITSGTRYAVITWIK
tara:strand:+ start:687 stop:1250 length:564 start_codon:yes stop_codon:yes gene_type:complete